MADRRRVAPARRCDHHRPRDAAAAFASLDAARADELSCGRGPRCPRPSRLADAAARSTPAPAAKGAERLGLHTVGDLLEHLPRDRREARTIAELGAGRGGDGRRRGALDPSRPGPPARDEAARRGDRRRRDRDHEGDVLQPAVARAQVPPGDAADAAGQVPGPQPLPGAVPRADRRAGGARRATSPPTRRPRGSRRRRSSRSCASTAARCADVVEPLPARLRAAGRLPDRAAALDAAHFGDQEGGPRGGWRSRSCCCSSSRCCGGARGAARPRAPRRSTRRATLTARWLARVAPVHADRRPARGDGGDRRGPRRGPADAAAADGRGRLGQDRRRALRDAARGRARRAGGADGADGDARRAALRDAADADARRAGAGGAAHRLDAARRAAPTCSASWRAAS